MNAPAQFAIGIDIGGTNTKVALVGADGQPVTFEHFPTATGDPDGFVERIAATARRCRGAADAAGAGVSVAGFIDAAHEHLSYNPNLEWLVGFPLRKSIAEALQLDVALEVDSNASCLAEYRYGAGRGSKRFLCLTAGTGLGGGVVLDGRLMRFMGECAGDLGHVVVDPNGPACPCGGRGCAEALVAERYIVAQTGRGASLRDVVAAAQAGETHAIAALEDAGKALGIAFASLSQVFFPDCVALAGGLAEAGSLVLASAERSFREYVNAEARTQVSFRKAELSWRAGVIGAAAPWLS